MMFLIGGPLGGIIKKGGLGLPFLISIVFFILYTLLGMQGEDLAFQNILNVRIAAWIANSILFIIGIAFLYNARRDGRLPEADFYHRLFSKLRKTLQTM